MPFIVLGSIIGSLRAHAAEARYAGQTARGMVSRRRFRMPTPRRVTLWRKLMRLLQRR